MRLRADQHHFARMPDLGGRFDDDGGEGIARLDADRPDASDRMPAGRTTEQYDQIAFLDVGVDRDEGEIEFVRQIATDGDRAQPVRLSSTGRA